MQAVILAAGTGSRLKDMTEQLPKALIPVAGKPLLAYAIAFAHQVGCQDIVVVAGAFGQKVIGLLKKFEVPGLRWVENKDYLIGNLYSLGAARSEIRTDFLLMNTDHVYRLGIAEKVRAQCGELTAFCDQDRELGDDDMKVALGSDGRLKDISKKLTAFDRGYVGMTFCPERMLDTYFQAFDRVAGEHGDRAVVEMVLDDLARNGSPPAIGDISGVGWLEVDTQDEHAHAENVILENPEAFSAVPIDQA
jgi:choline kinase